MPIKPRPLHVPIHTQKCSIQQVNVKLPQGEQERYVVSMSLTLGELIALHSMTSENESQGMRHRTPVATDVAAYIKTALERIGIRLTAESITTRTVSLELEE